MNATDLLSARATDIDVSGIRRVFELAASLKDPINLSIGQPDFPVPEVMRRAAAQAIEAGQNGYTLTQGDATLRARVAEHLKADLGWDVHPDLPPVDDPDRTALMITSGTSGALMLAAMALLDPGDEVIIPDPFFVVYPNIAKMLSARAVLCDTYPDFRMTAERVEPLITERTRYVLFNSPGNPTGVTPTGAECRELLELCRDKGVVLLSDEIYDEFVFTDAVEESPRGEPGKRCPSPARFEGAEDTVLLVRGFGKTYGCTGWRMGYAAGPGPIIREMGKLQQYSFVCAPSIAQAGCVAAFDADVSAQVADYQRRRDMVLEILAPVTEVPQPGGAFYLFPKVPETLGLTGTQLVEKAIEREVLCIPGGVFSSRDTNVRLSLSAPQAKLRRGVEILAELMS
jgi:aspartate/methionine/tyrosine aminotransferase